MKKILAIIVCCLFVSTVNAQVIYNSSGKKGEATYQKNAQKKGFDPHRLIFGGGFGGGFGDGTLVLGISPVVGYRLSDRFSAGLRIGYQFNWIKDGQLFLNGISGAVEERNINYHVIAPGVWGRFMVWNNIFLHTEYEYNVFTYKEFTMSASEPGYATRRAWDHANCLLVGLGLRQPVSDNASFVLEVYYDALQNIPSNLRTDLNGNQYSISPYAGRVDFRIGFNIGF